jgi:hypothetical protein
VIWPPFNVVSTNSERPGSCYRTSLTGSSSLGASASALSAFLQASWLFGLIGIKRDALDGSCESRLSASNRIIKISASIVTTFGSKRPNSDARHATPVPPKNRHRHHNICPVGLPRFQSRISERKLLLACAARGRLGFFVFARGAPRSYGAFAVSPLF